jgi:hypothetical protein
VHGTANVVRDLRCGICVVRAGDPPGLSSIPGGSSAARCRSQGLIVRPTLPLPRARHRNRETVPAMRTPWHRHHLPGIKNSPSRSYAEIGTDRLRTRPASVVREFALTRARPPRPVQHTGGSARVAIFDGQTVLPLRRARCHRETSSNENSTAPSPSARN